MASIMIIYYIAVAPDMAWRLLDLGALDGYEIQSVYEAIACSVGKGAQPNTLVLCHPKSPYVCVGYHQDISKEADEEYCKASALPIVRRQTGGGTVYLDSEQQFYHLIIRSPGSIPPKLDAMYEKYLAPAVETYRSFGLNAQFKPLNDIVIGGKKASGNGAASLEDCVVIIGNLILDISPEKLTRVLKVPSEKFREKAARSIEEWMTSFARELGRAPDRSVVKSAYVKAFESLFGTLEKGQMTEEENKKWKEVIARLKSDEWTRGRIRKVANEKRAQSTKISGNVAIIESSYKAQKLIRITMRVIDDKIDEISLTGDFFTHPCDALVKIEDALVGAKIDKVGLVERLNIVFSTNGIRIDGATIEDIAESIVSAKHRIA